MIAALQVCCFAVSCATTACTCTRPRSDYCLADTTLQLFPPPHLPDAQHSSRNQRLVSAWTVKVTGTLQSLLQWKMAMEPLSAAPTVST